MIDLQTAPKCLAVEPSSAEPRFDPVAEAVAHVYRDYGSALRLLMGSTGPLLTMMDPAEQAAYEALPQTVAIYRGCSAQHLTGLSWSLDPEVVRRFPLLARYRVPDPVLVTATVPWGKILAIKLDRGKAEVITASARRTRVEALRGSPNDALTVAGGHQLFGGIA